MNGGFDYTQAATTRGGLLAITLGRSSSRRAPATCRWEQPAPATRPAYRAPHYVERRLTALDEN